MFKKFYFIIYFGKYYIVVLSEQPSTQSFQRSLYNVILNKYKFHSEFYSYDAIRCDRRIYKEDNFISFYKIAVFYYTIDSSIDYD